MRWKTILGGAVLVVGAAVFIGLAIFPPTTGIAATIGIGVAGSWAAVGVAAAATVGAVGVGVTVYGAMRSAQPTEPNPIDPVAQAAVNAEQRARENDALRAGIREDREQAMEADRTRMARLEQGLQMLRQENAACRQQNDMNIDGLRQEVRHGFDELRNAGLGGNRAGVFSQRRGPRLGESGNDPNLLPVANNHTFG